MAWYDGILSPLGGGTPGAGGGGILSPLFADRQDSITAMGLGLLSGKNNAEGFEGAMQGFAQGRRSDLIRRGMEEEKAQKDREAAQIAQMAQKLGMPGDSDPQIVRQMFLAKFKPREPRELSFEERQFNQLTPEQQAKYREQKFLRSGGEGGFGMTPLYGTDSQGNPVVLQLGRDGSIHMPQLPPGVTLSKNPIKMDLGTEEVLIDPITRQVVSRQPKDLAGAKREEARGKAEGEAQFGAPAALDTANESLRLVEELEKHPGRKFATGGTSVVPLIPGTDPYTFEVRRKQVTSRAFLEGFEKLKGGGAITEIEGIKATEAIARLDRGQSEEEFVAALNDLKTILRDGQRRLKQRMGTTGAGGGSSTTAPVDLKKKYGLE